MRTIKRMMDKNLQSIYKKINNRFYEGALPLDCKVHFEKLGDEDGMSFGEHEIIINEKLKQFPVFVEVVLLHEMVHVSLLGYVGDIENDGDHGMRFQAGLDALYKKGAYDGLL